MSVLTKSSIHNPWSHIRQSSFIMGRKRKNACRPAGSPSSSDDVGPDGVVRNSANERERDRMRVLSKAFTRLKTTLPWVPPDTKLSKLDTLRLASSYIGHLARMLVEDAENNDSSVRRHYSHAADTAGVDMTTASVHPRKLVSCKQYPVCGHFNCIVLDGTPGLWYM